MNEKIKIVFADDNAQSLMLLKMLISMEDDMEVVGSASNGIDAIELAKELQPSILFLDVRMPEMTGFQAAEVLGKELPELPVVIMSADVTVADMIRAKDSGAKDMLEKPVARDELLACIRKLANANL
jgi:DNA-binding NarL/FixJ family response regulator